MEKNNTLTKSIAFSLPIASFIILIVTGIILAKKNSEWWTQFITTFYMPNAALYYTLSLLFVILLPFVWIAAIQRCTIPQCVTTHVIFILISLFLLLWLIYIYKVKNIRLALSFLAIAWFFMIISTIMLWSIGQQVGASIMLLMVLWTTVVWLLVNNSHQVMLQTMFTNMRTVVDHKRLDPIDEEQGLDDLFRE